MIRLTAGASTYTQPLTLKMDPRASITSIGLTRQFLLATRIAGMMNRTFASIANASRSASPQSPAPGSQSDLMALNNDLATALDVVEGADRAPTAQAAAAVAHLERRVNALLKGTP